jgi:ATP-binding cassette subfamily B (MDR/TAP) protein 1
MIKYIKKYTIEEYKSYGMAGQIAQEVLSSVRTVLALGIHKKALRNYEANLLVSETMAKKKGLLAGIFGGAQMCLVTLCFGLGVYYAVYLARSDCDNINVSNVMAAFFSVVTSSFSIGQAIPFLSELAAARGAAKKVYKILDQKSKIDVLDKTVQGKKPERLTGNIVFENIFFSYPSRPEASILNGLNLSIPAGKTIALVGSSGGGKSTVIGLVQRFYLPNTGTIRIDGEKIEDFDLNWLRSQMALVQQEPVLFGTTIR